MHELINNLGKEGTPCERVLGSEPKVNTIAAFNDKNYGLVQLITLHGIMEFTQNNSFSREEMDAFKAGIAYVGGFMAKCSEERAKKRDLEKRKNSGIIE